MIASPMSPALDAIWMASPPPPFPTSSFVSTALCFFFEHSPSAGRTELQSPSVPSERLMTSPLLLGCDASALEQNLYNFIRTVSPSSLHPIAFALSSGFQSPVLSLGSDQSLQRSPHRDCVQSPSDMNPYDIIENEFGTFPVSFQCAMGVGLGLGLGLPLQREYVLSARTDASHPFQVAPKSSGAASSTPAVAWGVLDALSAFLDTAHGLSLAIGSPRPPVLAPTTRLAHGHPPPYLRADSPLANHFKGTPVYQLTSPVLPAFTNELARRGPAPRGPRTCTAHFEVKFPIFEYHASTGTMPHDRHGWDVGASFNASRGDKKPFHRPADPVRFPAQDAPAPAPAAVDHAPQTLPWLRATGQCAPYTPLPRSPVLPSDVPREPHRVNNYQQINRYKSDAIRRPFSKPTLPDARLAQSQSESQEKAERRGALVREEEIARKERRARRWGWFRRAGASESGTRLKRRDITAVTPEGSEGVQSGGDGGSGGVRRVDGCEIRRMHTGRKTFLRSNDMTDSQRFCYSG
ncbi:hypothetical protein DFH09DRAFT_1089522 [Mycena vulgaris]|nr:hypothetical protein DFH09DRAFT_1089522 [Mycena vulgaris]